MKKRLLFISLMFTAFAVLANTETISNTEIATMLKKHATNDIQILDVRTKDEFDQAHIPTAINISHDEIAKRLNELAGLKNKTLVVHCRSGRRAAFAEQILLKHGFKVKHLAGDFNAWQAGKLPVESTNKKN